ncbi:Do family serine endopeptidase [Denitratisoma oestradiolicum]|uniref:Periplasmic serine endoprotease DegP-like n=1 Tax=Denitratisoma oestradiolicum TaxID=311182 RepID=A0A6S6Y324_9PROT|nr:Do family serine endopeptidase [Denitratisoma oestradiolicum]TWO79998.1 2-alkenal reductase [Denitratisoma oestradiolicum]CAB1369763.1 Periplasmic serine endoprotease DegP-like [Denitratisoma oestradiolicum]
MKRLWLIFAQTVTVCVAALFVVQTLKPGWLARRMPESDVIAIHEAANGPDDRRRVASYADAARKALPAVVHIYTSREVKAPRNPLLEDPFFRHFFGDRFGNETQRRAGLGSGVVVSADGYVLTNYHVVETADEIEVALNDGRKIKGRIVGTDPESDVAIIKIDADKLPVITFAQAESLRVGDVVLAIGNPFGVGQTVTSGIVSALGRSHLGINTFENFIQTDAAINPGNSGGALVDSDGNLVGINTAIYSQSGGSMGIGFAIPVSLARSVMEQIIRNGAVSRGWIGVEVQEITPELAESFRLPATEGALIAGVMRGSPADKAGVKPGDVLLTVNDKPVRDAQTMVEQVAALEPGRTSRLKLRRNNRDLDLPVEIGKRPLPQRQ